MRRLQYELRRLHFVRRLCFGLALMLVASGASRAVGAEAERLLVGKFCLSCHSADEPRGGLNLAAVIEDEVERHPVVWEKVVRRLRARQMPPAGEARPSGANSAS